MIREGSFEEAISVFDNIPEFERFLSEDEMKAKLIAGSLILITENDNELVGFKMGYPLNENEFYSWLGGVVPEQRKSGAAQKMLEVQEQWLKKQDYARVRVKSMNRFSGMLCMLIRNGYDIERVDEYAHPELERICFVKSL
ncbi:GNAT family N-acetyltransferase [Shewanella surugensis]|uniref:GNAT family N-acetyltransferase n=1 Tax=Shewanella surugensis TaxID=212020 RepID=A0ABT0LAR7_9GAMM|nr:GNAT family N-acetyltransferase [Shewanella surugensis]MCL1124769.1 GNAT family N-acetyltransferase [Shewanella surugensis]